MLQLIAQKTESLKSFTDNNYAQAGFYWNYLLKNKEIRVNGKRVASDIPLEKGDVVQYFLTKKQEEKPAFYKVYEDEHFLIVDKESGVNSEAVFSALSREGECYFIHRLDRNTKGLLAFAKTKSAEEALLNAFLEKRVEKRYHALCFGRFPKAQDTLIAYLVKDEQKALVKVFNSPKSGGEKIITEYKVLKTVEGMSLAEITLHTGKTHQIRAHLAHIGCPIVGDMKYGNSLQNKAKQVARQCLVAKHLQLNLGGEFAYMSGKLWTSRFEVNVE